MSLEASPPIHDPTYPSGAAVVPVAWDAQLPQVIAITQEMFGESPLVETMCDPDDADQAPFAMLRVHSRGSSQDLLARYMEWGQRLDALGAGLQYRLSIIPVT